MQVWRLLIAAAGGLHHLVLAAPDHQRAWSLALQAIGVADGTLEELENTGYPHAGKAGLLYRLPTGLSARAAGPPRRRRGRAR